MPSYSMEYVSSRRSDIRLAVRRSSPALVWCDADGITVIAARRNKTGYRITGIMDRFACITRGDASACKRVSDMAVIYAYRLAEKLSRGDVHPEKIAIGIGGLLSNSFHSYALAPLAAEAVIVQLREQPEDDYIGHVSYKGTCDAFDRVLFFGSIEREHDAEDEEAANHERLQQELLRAWTPHIAGEQHIIAALHGTRTAREQSAGTLRETFTRGQTEVLSLRREAFRNRRFRDIIQRQT